MSSISIEDLQLLFHAVPGAYLVLKPDFTIAEVSDRYLQLTLTKRNEVINQNLFNVFPDIEDDFYAGNKSCLTNLKASLNYVLEHGEAQTMTVQKYDLENKYGVLEERYWSPNNTPVLDSNNKVIYIIHQVEDVSAQKKADKQLNSFLQTMPDAAVIVDENGMMKMANSNLCLLSGYQQNEIVSKHINILLPQSITSILNNFQKNQQIDNEALRKTEFDKSLHVLRKDGALLPVEIFFSPVNADEHFLMAISIRDISAEKKIQASLSLLKQQVDQSNDALYTVNIQRKITSWNKGAERIFGFTVEEAIGKDTLQLLQTENAEEKLVAVLNMVAEKNYWSGELKRRRKDGTDIYVYTTISGVRNHENELTGYISVCIDISEQKKLQHQVTHLANIVEQSSEAIISRGLDRKIRSWNKGAERLLGITNEEAMGKTATELGFLKLTSKEQAELERKVMDTGIWRAEKKFYNKNGNEFLAGITANAVSNEEGKIDSVVFVVKDISLRKKLEDQLLHANELLEEKVKARTAEVLENEKKYRLLFENNPMPMWVVDQQHFKFLDVNQMAIYKYGYSREEFLSMTLLNIRPEEERQKFIESDHSSKIDKDNYNRGTWKHRKKDGSTLWAEITVQPVLYQGIPARLILANDVTEKKLAEERLAASEERFRSLIENSTDAVALINDSFKTIYRSPAAKRITGYSNEEFTVEGFQKIIHPDHLLKVTDALKESKRNPGKLINLSFKAIHKNGKGIWAEATLTNLLQNPHLNALVFNFRDVTERVTAEEKLTASEERYRHTLDNMIEGVQILGFDWKYIYVNNAAIAQARSTREELIGQSFLQKFPGIEQTELYQAFRRCFDERVPIHMENAFTYPDKSVAWYELSFQPVPEGVFVLSVDVTKRKIAEANADEQRVRLQVVSDNLPGVIIYQYITDADGKGKFTYLSREILKLTGQTVEEAIKEPGIIDSIIFEEDRPLLAAAEKEAAENFSVFNVEVRCNSVSDGFRWINFISTPRKMEGGQIIWDGFLIDITERKKIEQEIKQINAELEERVEQRTAQLKKSSDEMEAFSYSVSHDLRAPLRGIIGFSNILEEEYGNKLDDEAKRITGIIKSNTVKMGALIDDLLAFSRVGRHQVDKTLINTNDMVNQVIAGMDLKDKKEKIKWNIRVLHNSFGDLAAMRQVWINLISNAVKYSGEKPEQIIEIGSYELNRQVVFFVKDNGVGFDNKYVQKLFKVFQRLHAGADFEGTGVGLAIVEKIISKHDGKVWADAAVNMGATFYFSLPIPAVNSIVN